MSDLAVFVKGVRVGSVMRFEGEKPSTRWFAFASGDRKKGFRLRRQAVQWILDLLAADLAEEAAALCAIARAEESHV